MAMTTHEYALGYGTHVVAFVSTCTCCRALAHMRQLQLPPELLTYILNTLDPAEATTAVALARVQRSSRLFRTVACDPRIWQKLYFNRWRRHRSRAEYVELLLSSASTASSPTVDWQDRYSKRHRADRAAVRTIQRMTTQPVGRYVEAKTILQDEEMNVFDGLLEYQNLLLRTTPIYMNLGDKLWVREVLDALRRSETLQEWMQMLAAVDQKCPLAVISAFSGFRGSDKVEMDDKLERLTRYTRTLLGLSYLDSHPDPLEVVKGIIRCMEDLGICASRPAEFHRLRNHFLNLVIDEGGGTLPMSLVCIFCSIAQRLGLQASMIGFPGRILARVSGWIGQGNSSQDTEMPSDVHIIDIFENGKVLTREELLGRLSHAGLPSENLPQFIQPARPGELVARVARNIVNSLQAERGGIMHDSESSKSAHAAVAALLLLQPNNLIDALPNLLHQFPMDVYSIEKDYIPAVLREGIEGVMMADRLRRIQRQILERDTQPYAPRFRELEKDPALGDDKPILYSIGTVFRHRKWGYVGVIKSWDARCCADEMWMQSNDINSLDNGGRKQPFYSISADDGSDRYIAQINVVPMKTVSLNTLNLIIQSHEDLGHVFSQADPERARFVMNEAARRKYPEDARMEAEILSKPPEKHERLDTDTSILQF